MCEPELKNGKIFTFFDAYETHEAKVSYGRTLAGHRAFKIWFNGKFLIISRTFAPVEIKLNELIGKYRLIEDKSE